MGLGTTALNTNQKKESGAPFSPAAANNGLSVDPVSGKIVLGNDVAAPGDPAQLLSPREILSGSNSIDLRQGPFGTGGFSLIGAAQDGNVGGLFHCFTGVSNNEPTGTIIYRATQALGGAMGAFIQLECPNDVASAVIQVAAWGSNPAVAAFRRGTGGIQSTNNVQPDLVFQANGIGGVRAGRILFATSDTIGTETLTYSFLLPVLANLDFPNTLSLTSSDLTIAVPGAADGDSVSLGVPIVSQVANSCYTAFVSAPNVVTVRFNNYSAAPINPAAGNFKVAVVKLL